MNPDHAAPASAEATMKQFRKKPVVIEAEQLTEAVALDCLENRKPFAFGLTISGSWNAASNQLYSAWISIDTLEGQMRAELGDWIIKGVKEELYPYKPDIFEATYDAVTAHNGTADTGNTSGASLRAEIQELKRQLAEAKDKVKKLEALKPMNQWESVIELEEKLEEEQKISGYWQHAAGTWKKEWEAETSEVQRLSQVNEKLVEALKVNIEGKCQENPHAVHPSKRFCTVCGFNSESSVHHPKCPIKLAEDAIKAALAEAQKENK